jgi:sugar (pentulose or hexulose) kinase
MPRPSYLGIDVGTSGCRAVVLDEHGDIIAGARQSLPPSRHPQAGYSEQTPQDWWDALTTVVQEVGAPLQGTAPRLCIDGTSSTLLLIDSRGQAITPGLMYDDRRAVAAAARIAARAPIDSPARGVGSALSKLLHLIDAIDPPQDTLALHQADWLTGKLTGSFGISDENNALKLGYDPVTRAWPDWLAGWSPVCRHLPRVTAVGTPIGRINPAVAAELHLPQETTVVAGSTDSNAATLAASGCQLDDVGSFGVTSLGSTLVIKLWSDRPIFSARYGVYSHRIGQRWLVGGASNTGGQVLRQFFSDEQLETLSCQIDPAKASGLDYYPLPASGERFPVSDPDLPPRLTPRPDDDTEFLHGLLEGIARIETEGYRRLEALGAPYPERVISAGGGATNRTWEQIRAGLLGVPVEHAAHQDAAYGAACIARMSTLAGKALS